MNEWINEPPSNETDKNVQWRRNIKTSIITIFAPSRFFFRTPRNTNTILETQIQSRALLYSFLNIYEIYLQYTARKGFITQQAKGQSWSTFSRNWFFIYKINTKVHDGVSDSSAGVAKSQKTQATTVKLVARMLGQSSN